MLQGLLVWLQPLAAGMQAHRQAWQIIQQMGVELHRPEISLLKTGKYRIIKNSEHRPPLPESL